MLRYFTIFLLLPINTIFAYANDAFTQTSNISEIRDNLEGDECYLIYGKERGYLISTKQAQVFKINPKEVAELISIVREEVALFEDAPFEHDPSVFLGTARQLYAQLILPIETHLEKRVHIMPSHEYAMIPWNALLSGKDEYILERYEVTIKDRISEKKEISSRKQGLRLKVIAPHFVGALSISNKEEKELIHGILKPSESDISNCNILHISSHGDVDMSDSNASGILLGENEKLSSKEIAKLSIEAELVFLNICDGALKSNDNRSIVDAFTEAGAKTAIGALWEIDDHMAKELSTLFYKEILRGSRSGEALRRSLLRYQKDCKLSKDIHPFRWAGYQVYGENTPIVHEPLFGLKRVLSMFLSLLTSLSLISYHFGRKILAKIPFYRLTFGN